MGERIRKKMMIQRSAIKILHLISKDLVYSDRSGDSLSFSRHKETVLELTRSGYCVAAPAGGCRVDYIVTPKGEASLKAFGG
jgi:hypothetical protein